MVLILSSLSILQSFLTLSLVSAQMRSLLQTPALHLALAPSHFVQSMSQWSKAAGSMQLWLTMMATQACYYACSHTYASYDFA